MPIEFPELAAIRLGFGLSPLMAPPQDLETVLASAAATGPGPQAMTTPRAQQISLKIAALNKARREGGEAEEAAFAAHNREMGKLIGRDLQRRLARAVDAEAGFGERLVQFWADHFTVSPMAPPQNSLTMAFVDEAIRPHVNGRFEDLFFAADTHPMMLVYLNQNASRGPNSVAARRRPEKEFGLNENLAREAMELHSLGVGAPYTQDDVREMAELLTGLTYSPQDGFVFRAQITEPGAETVLGQRYGGTRRDGIEAIRAAFGDLARRPETAQHISRKLAVHFISDDPSADLVEAMAATWRDTGGDLPQVYRVMVTHPEMAANLHAKARQPFDFLAAGFRALGLTGKQITAIDFPAVNGFLLDPMLRMGQPWLRPTGPDGWPEDASAWIAPQLLAARINWALRVPGKVARPLPDPRDLLGTALGSTRSEELAWAVPKAESQAEGVAIILASRDFNRR